MKKVLLLSLILVFTFCWTEASATRKCQTSNCQVCSSIGVCVMCQPGHMLSINKQLMASQCIAQKCQVKNCFRCINENICAQCETGFSLGLKSQCVKENALKKEIQNRIQNCKKMSVDGKCEECFSGLKLIEGKCLADFLNLAEVEQQVCTQITNCLTCIGSNFCTSCSTGFVPSGSGDSCITNCTIANCLLCSTSTACSVCQNGYTLTGNGLNCAFQNTSNCMAYSPTNPSTCAACYLAYNLTTDNQCIYAGCTYPCQTCNYTTSQATCITCLSPFSVTAYSNGTCFTCQISNCVNCNSSTSTICIACAPNYALSTDNTTCLYNCQGQNCQTCGGNGCSACVQGFYLLSNGTCQSCSVTFCANCTTNSSQCSACMPGFFLNNNNTACISCNVTGCSVCNQTNNCQTYQPNAGFLTYLLPNGTYIPYLCDIGCASCAPKFPLQCLQCSPGYYMQINATSTLAQCFPCSPNCVACTSATNCTICASNAYFNSTNNNCTVCNISSNCLTCNITYDKNGPITSCTACLPGFSLFINASSFGYCQTPCPVNCLTCFNSTNTPLSNNLTNNISCSACNPGFGLTYDGFCLPCLSNCRVCSGQQTTICISCGSGFYLNPVNSTYTTCLACPGGCSSCTATSCLSCFPQFVLANTTATTLSCILNCPYPCATCLPDQNTLCQSCLLGFYLYPKNNSCLLNPNASLPGSPSVYCGFGSYYNTGNNSCLACGDNCLRCIAGSPKTCTSCMYGFYVDNNTCQPCNSSCLACSSQNTCLTCKPNFALINLPLATNQVYCSFCYTPCSQCTSNPQECTACLPGFTFTGFNCVSNFYYIFTITFNTNAQTFFNNYANVMAQVLTGLTTQNMRATSVNNISIPSSTNASANIQITLNLSLSTFVYSGSKQANYEYNNLYLKLMNQNPFGNLPVLSSNLSYYGVVPQIGSDIPTICGIVIPIGVVIIIGLLYCFFSKNNMDLPGSDYVPLEKSVPTKMTELRPIQ